MSPPVTCRSFLVGDCCDCKKASLYEWCRVLVQQMHPVLPWCQTSSVGLGGAAWSSSTPMLIVRQSSREASRNDDEQLGAFWGLVSGSGLGFTEAKDRFSRSSNERESSTKPASSQRTIVCDEVTEDFLFHRLLGLQQSPTLVWSRASAMLRHLALYALVVVSSVLGVLSESGSAHRDITTGNAGGVLTDLWDLTKRPPHARAGALEDGRRRFHDALDALQNPKSCDNVTFCHCRYADGFAGLFSKLHSRAQCALASVLRNCTLIDLPKDRIAGERQYTTTECQQSNASSQWECYFKPLTPCQLKTASHKTQEIILPGAAKGCESVSYTHLTLPTIYSV